MRTPLFLDSWAVFWFGSKGLNGMRDLFLLLLLLPLLVLLLVLQWLGDEEQLWGTLKAGQMFFWVGNVEIYLRCRGERYK